MDGGSIERLELKPGEKVTAAHVAQLDANIARNAGLPGTGVRRRVYPWGTSRSYFGRDGIGSSPIFQPEVSFFSDDTAEVRWTGPRALIGGLAPSFSADPKGPDIFTPDDKTGETPALTVSRKDFDADSGECGIYFQVEAGPETGYYPLRVTPITSAVLPPAPTPRMGYKLALFLRLREGEISYLEDADRELHCSQGFLAVNVHAATMKFESLFWALF